MNSLPKPKFDNTGLERHRQAVRRKSGAWFMSSDDSGCLETVFWLLEDLTYGLMDWLGFKLSVKLNSDSSILLSENRGYFRYLFDAFETISHGEALDTFPQLYTVASVSEWLELDGCSEETCFHLRFEEGILVNIESSPSSGREAFSSIRYQPDLRIFSQAKGNISYTRLSGRLRNLAACCTGAAFSVSSTIDGFSNHYCYPNGLKDYLIETLEGWPQYSFITLKRQQGSEIVEIELAWIDRRLVQPHILTFVNGRQNLIPGSHIEGLELGLEKLTNSWLLSWAKRSMDGFDNNYEWNSVWTGLVCGISVWTQTENYADSVSRQFSSDTIRDMIAVTVAEDLPAILENSPNETKHVVRCISKRKST